MNIIEYSNMKVKKLVDFFAFIGAQVEEDDLVSVTLNDPGKEYRSFWTSSRV